MGLGRLFFSSKQPEKKLYLEIKLLMLECLFPCVLRDILCLCALKPYSLRVFVLFISYTWKGPIKE
jgi:hypothetical protein